MSTQHSCRVTGDETQTSEARSECSVHATPLTPHRRPASVAALAEGWHSALCACRYAITDRISVIAALLCGFYKAYNDVASGRRRIVGDRGARVRGSEQRGRLCRGVGSRLRPEIHIINFMINTFRCTSSHSTYCAHRRTIVAYSHATTNRIIQRRSFTAQARDRIRSLIAQPLAQP